MTHMTYQRAIIESINDFADSVRSGATLNELKTNVPDLIANPINFNNNLLLKALKDMQVEGSIFCPKTYRYKINKDYFKVEKVG